MQFNEFQQEKVMQRVGCYCDISGVFPVFAVLLIHISSCSLRCFRSGGQEKLNYFWIVEKKKLEDKKAELRNKEREMQDIEEKHQVEVKVCQSGSWQLACSLCVYVTVLFNVGKMGDDVCSCMGVLLFAYVRALVGYGTGIQTAREALAV